MLANYHTHTPRCHHAVGSEREYIENAIKSGIKILGFSDHSPQFYKNGFVSGMRMSVNEAPGYIECIKKLADEYKDDIQIFAGFEAEYFPDIFYSLQKLCRDYGADYLIMGQHFLDDESKGIYVGSPFSEPELLHRYVDQVIEGISSGSFSYIAHPDVTDFIGKEAVFETEMTRLCVYAKRMGIPLEVNMLGLEGNRHYPSRRFFNIAASVGNDVVIGCDAHNPAVLLDTDMHKKTLEFVRSFGVEPIGTTELKKI